jgi:hypothetical protein
MSTSNVNNACNEVNEVYSPPLESDTPIIDVENDNTTQCNIDWKNPPFFKLDKVQVKEYWEVVSLVAPYVNDSKVWKTSDAISAYCTKCKIKLSWCTQNPKAVQRHMNKYHNDILTESKKPNRAFTMEVKTLDHFYSKKLKTDLLPPSKADQTKGKTLLVKWVAESLRPFTVVEDKGFCEFVQF